jgi:hypothetical protein
MQDGLGPVDAVALIDLVRDAILEAIKEDDRHRLLLVRIESLRANAKGLLTAIDKLTADMTGAAESSEDE